MKKLIISNIVTGLLISLLFNGVVLAAVFTPKQISNPQTAPVKGQLFVVETSSSTNRFNVCANGKVPTGSSTAPLGWSCESSSFSSSTLGLGSAAYQAVSYFQTNLNGNYVATTTGSWLGTWQSLSPAYFQTALGYTPASSTVGTAILKGNGTGGFASASNGTDFTLITALSCPAGQHLASTTATGTFTCSADTGAGGSATSSWTRDNTNGYVYLTTSTDSVGIGTSTPAAKLEVVGDFKVSATSTMGGNVVVNTGAAGTSTISVGQSTNPACLELWDSDNGAYSYATFLNGVMYVSDVSCQ